MIENQDDVPAGSRTVQVMDTIRRKVDSRSLVVGDRLPSIRGLARSMGLSPSTVAEAYDRLAADGLIRARPGSGFYVAKADAPLDLAALGPRLDRPVDPLWVARQSLDTQAENLKPGCGWLPDDWLPGEAIRRALRRLSRGEDALLFGYGQTRGAPALRQMLARRFALEGLEVSADQILLAGSGTQAIDLVCRFLLRPGEAVLVDDPCYFNFQSLLRAHQARIIGVPMTPDGPDLARFAEAAQAHAPRLYITNSGSHNPTGVTLSPRSAHHLLNMAAAHNITIVEDDIFGDFEPEPSPRLAALDGLSRVVRIGSFSKTLSASVRCGYIAARPDWIEGLIDLQVATSFAGAGPVAAELVASLLGEGGYRKHLETLRRRLAQARSHVAERLGRLGIVPWVRPRAGFYLWCALPEGRDAAQVAQAALREGVVLAPGNVFSPSLSAGNFMRFNVAQMEDERVWSVLARALEA